MSKSRSATRSFWRVSRRCWKGGTNEARVTAVHVACRTRRRRGSAICRRDSPSEGPESGRSPRRSNTVRSRARSPARRDDRWLEIAVTDTGIGIAEEDLPKLFNPLVQLDSGLARRHGGVGLGLALAHRLARLHGDTIEVESEPGKGSTFTLRLSIREES
ncbi:hypothetical protein CLG94_11870 [Candidatus Methylomirabilis limnetica]|uniref:histidine kinase n=1 Tax=Candidatus Methylomirabilis limnetica TaxID=2033718 RepID=A0A2T4TV97_9BACT|nr:hypothetical protein CLG94_11870 [Candidatus Methylomirabilis limnetica]